MDAKYKGVITCSNERLDGNVAVLLIDPQEKFRGAGEVGEGQRTIQITNVMELVGIKIDFTKLDCLNQKKAERRYDNVC